ncbi:MAG: N-acetylmuramoyl-L-alanine amidase [Eubacterium sp.]|jgi:N-acetylmuramoyl-L-alanine amidase|nr:N-acetylmuramoyl-L-alanine amidase [Eubacterium sp.]
MKIIVTVGHSILKNGSCTSADGRSFHGVLEYAYNKEIVERIAAYLRSAGHEADTVVCPEYRFESSAEEKSYKLPKVNGGGYDLAVELHLNASEKHNARGCEALYLSEKGKAAAQKIQARLATVFQDRGVQKRPNLYMLNGTVPPAVMIESFFCDNSEDCALAAKTDVARLIAEGIHGREIDGDVQEGKTLYRVQTGSFSVKENAEKLKEELMKKGFDAVVVNDPGKAVYRIQAGAYSAKSNAQEMKRKLIEEGFDAIVVTA